MRETNKIEKAIVLYVFDPPTRYSCSECAFITSTGECSDYVKADRDVKAYGSCNNWRSLVEGRIAGNHDHTREATGYAENREGFSCKRCDEFIADTRRCQKVDEAGGLTPGIIHPNACCNRWEPSPTKRNLTDAEFRGLRQYR